jgi:hypothetical protein
MELKNKCKCDILPEYSNINYTDETLENMHYLILWYDDFHVELEGRTKTELLKYKDHIFNAYNGLKNHICATIYIEGLKNAYIDLSYRRLKKQLTDNKIKFIVNDNNKSIEIINQ